MKLSELIEALQRAQLGALISDPEVTIEFDCNILDVISDNEGVHILAIKSMNIEKTVTCPRPDCDWFETKTDLEVAKKSFEEHMKSDHYDFYYGSFWAGLK